MADSPGVVVEGGTKKSYRTKGKGTSAGQLLRGLEFLC